MIIDCQNPVRHIIGVERIKCGGGTFNVSPREYAALSFRMRGSVTVTANDKDYPITTGDVLYLPQHLPYTAQYHNSEIIAIHFDTEKDDPVPEVYRTGGFDDLYRLFLNAELYWESKTPGCLPYVYSQMYRILGKIGEDQAAEQWPDYFLNAVSFINAHFKDNHLSVRTVCTETGISGTSLRTLFNKYYQKSPIAYITQLRLEYARTLIACGVSVEAAASRSGFCDAKYLARSVKSHYGCTPRDLKTYGK